MTAAVLLGALFWIVFGLFCWAGHPLIGVLMAFAVLCTGFGILIAAYMGDVDYEGQENEQ